MYAPASSVFMYLYQSYNTCILIDAASLIFTSAFTKQEMDLAEKNLKAELENVQASLNAGQSSDMSDSEIESKVIVEAEGDTEALLEKLDNKKKELVCWTFLFSVICSCFQVHLWNCESS